MNAPEGIGIESRAGDISATCLKDFTLQSREGSVRNFSITKLRKHRLDKYSTVNVAYMKIVECIHF